MPRQHDSDPEVLNKSAALQSLPAYNGASKGVPMQWLPSVLASIAIAIAGWAHATLWTMNGELKALQERYSNHALVIQELKESIKEVNGKLDRVLDELRKRP